MDFRFLRLGQVYVKKVNIKEDGLFAKVSFEAGDVITFYPGVQRKKPKGSDRVPGSFEEYQIEVPGGYVLIPWDSLMNQPGGFKWLDICGHMINHTTNLRRQNIEFHAIEASLFKDIPEAQNPINILRRNAKKHRCTWKYVVIVVASRSIEPGEELQGNYHTKATFAM